MCQDRHQGLYPRLDPCSWWCRRLYRRHRQQQLQQLRVWLSQPSLCQGLHRRQPSQCQDRHQGLHPRFSPPSWTATLCTWWRRRLHRRHRQHQQMRLCHGLHRSTTVVSATAVATAAAAAARAACRYARWRTTQGWPSSTHLRHTMVCRSSVSRLQIAASHGECARMTWPSTL